MEVLWQTRGQVASTPDRFWGAAFRMSDGLFSACRDQARTLGKSVSASSTGSKDTLADNFAPTVSSGLGLGLGLGSK